MSNTRKGYWEPDPEERETDGGVWRKVDDNRLPNPDLNELHALHNKELREYERTQAAPAETKAKIIMSYEFSENPEGYEALAHEVVDSYNEAHKLRVFGEPKPKPFYITKYDEKIETGFDAASRKKPPKEE